MLKVLALLLLLMAPAYGQTANNKGAMTTEINTNLPDNIVGAITPAILRTTLIDMVTSYQQFPCVNSQTGTTYPIVVTDYGCLITFNNVAATAVSIPQATGTFSKFGTFVRNLGAGVVTITPTTSTIDGNPTLVLGQRAAQTIVSDGTNYQLANHTPATNAIIWAGAAAGAFIDAAGALSASQLVTLTDAATILVDLSTFKNATVTLGGNRTLGNPTNTAAMLGQCGHIYPIQDGTGTRTLAYASSWRFTGAVAPTLSTAVNSVDMLNFCVRDATHIDSSLIKDFR